MRYESGKGKPLLAAFRLLSSNVNVMESINYHFSNTLDYNKELSRKELRFIFLIFVEDNWKAQISYVHESPIASADSELDRFHHEDHLCVWLTNPFFDVTQQLQSESVSDELASTSINATSG